MKLIFATHNGDKVREIQLAIGDQLQIVSLLDAGITQEIPEPHETLRENALEKSRTIYLLTNGADCFSEDTGLEVDALNGEPGVRSARYAGEPPSAARNIDKLLARLGDSTHRQARFRTIISLVLQDKEYFFEGICDGHILQKRKGSDGFGYDPIFTPTGSAKSFAEMSGKEKNLYSHRKKAAEKMIIFLKQEMATR